MEKQEIEIIIDTLDQATLALKFYVATQESKYLQEFKHAVNNLQQLLKKKGVQS